ncbi:MAG: aromatic hydrocarbon degradation protein, partial [Chitinophagaceae bacterium]|nr:aromatic hydrocarbon degradation protein [Chitinophagaceae bacterium]
MKRRVILFALTLCASAVSYAQLPEDALRMSWNTQSGTARSQAVGGAVGPLGGDLSSIFVNPAGLGFYRTNEIVLTPGFSFLNNKGSFRGTEDVSAKRERFAMGTSGLVFSLNNRYSPWAQSLGLAVNRTADFNSVIQYRGFNDLSSYSEQFLEEAAFNRLDTNTVYDFPFTSGLAYYTYLIDTIQDASGNIGGFKSLAPLETGLNQERTVTSSGGITEIAFAFAAAKADRFYMGATLGIPILNYKRTTVFRESDATEDPANSFNFSEYTQNYSSTGAGINLKLGAIFKPVDAVRLGLSIHTPTLYGLSERSSTSMTTDTENYPPSPGLVSINSDELTESSYFRYNFTSPWRFLISGAYVFGEEEDVRNQKGFISADIEYLTYGSPRFSASQSDFNDPASDGYYDGVNDATKLSYKGAFNARLGGELKFNTLMVRGGFGYYGNPYEDKELKARRMNISGGLGYRNRGFFVDLTYNHQLSKDVDFP